MARASTWGGKRSAHDPSSGGRRSRVTVSRAIAFSTTIGSSNTPRIVSHFGQTHEIPTQLWSGPLISIQSARRKPTAAPHFGQVLIVNLQLFPRYSHSTPFNVIEQRVLRRRQCSRLLAHEPDRALLC